MTIHELDVIALTVPLPDAHMYDSSEDLQVGDQGTIIDEAPTGRYFTVESFRDSETVAIETVTPDQVALVHAFRPTPEHKTITV